MEGDAATACAFSSSSEMMAFGGSGGYAHLWATTATPRVNMVSQPLDFPTPIAKPPRLTEQDSFALPFPYGATQVCSARLSFACTANPKPISSLSPGGASATHAYVHLHAANSPTDGTSLFFCGVMLSFKIPHCGIPTVSCENSVSLVAVALFKAAA